MKVEKLQTETYLISEAVGLDPVTAYVTNYGSGRGMIVIRCYGKAWAAYWGSMGQTLQQFFMSASNSYIINKMLENTTQTDFDKISRDARSKGFDICATSDAELAMQANDMRECFGSDWYMDLPSCETEESKYLGRILDAVRLAFERE